jgi:hypothetical protein
MNTMVKLEEDYVLNATDRCDSCHAQAYVVVKGVTGELIFCGHHYVKNKEALKKFAYEIIDERSRIIQSPSIGQVN